MEELRYKAFISYRHTTPDREIAAKLHTLIENYSIPKNIRDKLGIRKMGRVFRDEEELPLSTDLGGDIHAALENSEWLIVICSPKYLESKWCNAELDYFISLGKRDHILTLLAQGEPGDVFPSQLRFIERDGKTEEIEPLAGDVRADTVAGSLKKLNSEKLRILAPMLGVTYDELRQRARRRSQRILAMVARGVFALMSGFLGYSLVKNGQIKKQRDIAYDNQMQLLIEESNTASSSGNKLLAVTDLLQAEQIRKDVGNSNDDRFRAALEYALYNQAFEPILTIDNNNRQFDELVFSHNDDYLLGITNLNSACLIDAKTGKILYTVSRSDIGQLDSVGFTLDDEYFYMVDSWYNFVSLYSVKDGSLFAQFNASDGKAWNIGDKVFTIDDSTLLIPKEKELILWNYRTDKVESILPCGDAPFEGYIRNIIIDISPDRQSVAVGSHGYGAGMKVLGMDGTLITRLESDPQRGYGNIQYSGDGKRIAGTSGSYYCVWDAASGRLILNESVGDGEWVDHILINEDGSILLIMSSTFLKAVKVDDGRILWEKYADSNVVTEAYMSPDGTLVGTSGGIQGVFEVNSGKVIYPDGATTFSSDGSKVMAAAYGNRPRLLVTPAAATLHKVAGFSEELFSTPRFSNPGKSITVSLRHNPGEIYTTPPGNAGRKSAGYISPNLKYAAQTHYDGFIEVFDISDPDDPKNAFCLAEHCYSSVEDLIFSDELMASCGGFDPRCVLYDLDKGQIRYVLAGREYCHGCEFSPDGSKIIMLCGYELDKAYVYSTESGNLLYLMEPDRDRYFTRIGFTPDGSKAVAVMDDGSALVGEVYTDIDELIRQARLR